jgi:hypothetical protein
MVDPAHFESKFSQLNLGAFPAINQEELLIEPDYLRRRKSLGGWQGRTASEYSNRERIHIQ